MNTELQQQQQVNQDYFKLKKEEGENQEQEVYTDPESNSHASEKAGPSEEIRAKKHKWQIQILKRHHTPGKDWKREQILQLSQETKLTPQQVYKWQWDQKAKHQRSLLPKRENVGQNKCTKQNGQINSTNSFPQVDYNYQNGVNGNAVFLYNQQQQNQQLPQQSQQMLPSYQMKLSGSQNNCLIQRNPTIKLCIEVEVPFPVPPNLHEKIMNACNQLIMLSQEQKCREQEIQEQNQYQQNQPQHQQQQSQYQYQEALQQLQLPQQQQQQSQSIPQFSPTLNQQDQAKEQQEQQNNFQIN